MTFVPVHDDERNDELIVVGAPRWPEASAWEALRPERIARGRRPRSGAPRAGQLSTRLGRDTLDQVIPTPIDSPVKVGVLHRTIEESVALVIEEFDHSGGSSWVKLLQHAFVVQASARSVRLREVRSQTPRESIVNAEPRTVRQ